MPRTSRSRPFVACFGIALAVVAAWLAWPTDPNAPAVLAREATAGSPSNSTPAAAQLGERTPAEAGSNAATRESAGALSSPTDAAPPRRGRVVDSRGLALADVPIAWVPVLQFANSDGAWRIQASDCRATSDARGDFTLPPPDRESVPAAGPGWCTLRTTSGTANELLVIASKCIALRGRITRADDGSLLADAAVLADSLFLRDFPTKLEHTLAPAPDPACRDANGDYLLPHAPLAAGVDLLFTCPGFHPRRVPSLDAASGRLDVALTPESSAAGRIHGRARDAQGPVRDANVQLGFDQTTTTDARGEFSFVFPKQPSRLVATRPGWQPLVRERIGEDTPEIELVFAQPALTIEGRVQHADGTAAPGFQLDLVDPVRGHDYRPVELACRSTYPRLDCFTTTDADGHFAVDGLAERSYRLLAYDPKSLIAVTSEPIAAGARDIVLTIPADACIPELRGVVVDRRGTPIADAALHAWLAPASAEQPHGGATATTGRDGRFTLLKVPRRGVQLGASKQGWLYAVQPIEAWTRDGTELRVVLQRLCAVRIEGEADLVVRFLDSDGKPVRAESHSQTVGFSTDAVTLRGGKSPVMSLAEATATMVWSRGGKELGRKGVFLDPAPDAVTLLIAAN